jgi:hypothetical protein
MQDGKDKMTMSGSVGGLGSASAGNSLYKSEYLREKMNE